METLHARKALGRLTCLVEVEGLEPSAVGCKPAGSHLGTPAGNQKNRPNSFQESRAVLRVQPVLSTSLFIAWRIAPVNR